MRLQEVIQAFLYSMMAPFIFFLKTTTTKLRKFWVFECAFSIIQKTKLGVFISNYFAAIDVYLCELQPSYDKAVDLLSAFMSLVFLRVRRIFKASSRFVFGSYSTMYTHDLYYLQSSDFENLFKDSGYWDYFILSTYDAQFRLYAVYTLFVVSDYSVVEKASWRGIGFLFWPLNLTLYLELRSVGEFMLYAFVWFVTISVVVVFFMLTVVLFF